MDPPGSRANSNPPVSFRAAEELPPGSGDVRDLLVLQGDVDYILDHCGHVGHYLDHQGHLITCSTVGHLITSSGSNGALLGLFIGCFQLG